MTPARLAELKDEAGRRAAAETPDSWLRKSDIDRWVDRGPTGRELLWLLRRLEEADRHIRAVLPRLADLVRLGELLGGKDQGADWEQLAEKRERELDRLRELGGPA